MALTNYHYLVTLGHTCAPTFQLMRAAAAMATPTARYSGPFDRVGLGIDQVIAIVERDFAGYFEPTTTRIVGAHDAY